MLQSFKTHLILLPTLLSSPASAMQQMRRRQRVNSRQLLRSIVWPASRWKMLVRPKKMTKSIIPKRLFMILLRISLRNLMLTKKLQKREIEKQDKNQSKFTKRKQSKLRLKLLPKLSKRRRPHPNRELLRLLKFPSKRQLKICLKSLMLQFLPSKNRRVH